MYDIDISRVLTLQAGHLVRKIVFLSSPSSLSISIPPVVFSRVDGSDVSLSCTIWYDRIARQSVRSIPFSPWVSYTTYFFRFWSRRCTVFQIIFCTNDSRDFHVTLNNGDLFLSTEISIQHIGFATTDSRPFTSLLLTSISRSFTLQIPRGDNLYKLYT